MSSQPTHTKLPYADECPACGNGLIRFVNCSAGLSYLCDECELSWPLDTTVKTVFEAHKGKSWSLICEEHKITDWSLLNTEDLKKKKLSKLSTGESV